MKELAPLAFDTALKNEQLIGGAIKAAGVYSCCEDYEDIFQEGIITFASEYQKLVVEQNICEVDFKRLVFKKIIWTTIDILRKQRNIPESVEDEVLESVLVDEQECMDLIIEIENLAKSLTKLELIILAEHLIKGKLLKDIAFENRISLKTVQRTKKKLLTFLKGQLTK